MFDMENEILVIFAKFYLFLQGHPRIAVVICGILAGLFLFLRDLILSKIDNKREGTSGLYYSHARGTRTQVKNVSKLFAKNFVFIVPIVLVLLIVFSFKK